MPVTGGAQLRAIAVRLKETGEGGLRRELLRGLKTAAAPLIPELQAAAREHLPRRGGLNEQVAKQRITVSVQTGARTAGIRLVTRAPDTGQTDQGFVRHPTFGRRGKGDWKYQKLPNAAGWWSGTLAGKSPEVTVELMSVLTRVAERIQA